MDNVLNPSIKTYFDKMKTGQKIQVWNQRYPLILIYAAKEYIELGGQLEFDQDMEHLKKLPLWP